VGKKGVVRDPKVHLEVIHRVVDIAREMGFVTRELTFSPVKGPEGNIEYLIWLTRDQGAHDNVTDEVMSRTVELAHSSLDK